MSKITLNIVEPGSSTPVDPGINPAVPNTGLFTHGIGGPEATIITVSIVAVLAVALAAVLYCKHNKTNKTTKLTNAINAVKHKKKLSIPLAALAMVVSLGTLAALLVNAGKSNTNAAENELTVTESSEDLTIEVGDQPVFAVLPVELTVAEATDAGYTLTAFTDGTDIASTTDPANTIPMIAASEDPSALTDNTWGLSLEQPQDENSEVYTTLSIDQSTPTILKSIDDYSETEENDTTTIYYGFYITPDIPYGTYEGSSITYSATPNYITALSFNGNGNDGGEDMDSIIIPAGTTITLPENTFTKDGYHFAGWNTNAEGTGELYTDEAEYVAIAGESTNVTLYAQWEEDGPTIVDLTYMQDFKTLSEKDKATVLKSMVEDEQYQLKDSRDQKQYYISKLKDDNIWMTQNLDLDIVAGKTYTSTDTDVATNWIPTRSTTTGTTWDDNMTGLTAPHSYDPGNLYWNGNVVISSDGTIDNSTIIDPSAISGSAHYHIGNYYNWTAAVAMNSSRGNNSGDMDQSICPAGWRLPTYSGDKSYENLASTQDLTAGTSGNIQNSPVYFVYGGYWRRSSYNVGNMGYYWSSVVINEYNAYTLGFYGFDNDNLYPQFNKDRTSGGSIRCVVR